MNIAVMIKMTTLHKGYGGLETQNKALCEGLIGKGHRITIFSPQHDLVIDELSESGIRYIFVKCVYRMGPVFGFFGSIQKSNWINRSVEEFEKLHKQDKFDVVLAHSSSGLGVIRNKKRLKVKVISIAHGTIIGEYKTFTASIRSFSDLPRFIQNTGFTIKNFFRRQRDYVHGSDKIVAVSNFVKKSLLDETFTFDKKIVVIHNGINPAAFTNIPSSRGDKILYVGQITRSKGVFDLFRMSQTEKLRNSIFEIIGGGSDFDVLNNRLKIFPDRNNFRLLGKLDYQEIVKKYYLNKDYGVFVLPTRRYEGLPMVLIEAMFAGLPIVAYDMGGVSDAVEDNVNGFLIKPNKFYDFTKKLKELLDDENLKKKMGENSYNKAHELFDITKMIDKYEEVVKEVIS